MKIIRLKKHNELEYRYFKLYSKKSRKFIVEDFSRIESAIFNIDLKLKDNREIKEKLEI